MVECPLRGVESRSCGVRNTNQPTPAEFAAQSETSITGHCSTGESYPDVWKPSSSCTAAFLPSGVRSSPSFRRAADSAEVTALLTSDSLLSRPNRSSPSLSSTEGRSSIMAPIYKVQYKSILAVDAGLSHSKTFYGTGLPTEDDPQVYQRDDLHTSGAPRSRSILPYFCVLERSKRD